jgi:drug/metabolite transporter (DMT)-like permease
VLVSSDLQLGGDDGDSQMKLLGQGAMLISSFLYGISNVYARAKFRHTAPVYQAFYTLLICGALMWVVTPVVESPFSLPAQPITWVAIAWLGMLGAGLSYLLFYKLLHQIGPTKVATVTYTIPVVGVTLGVVFLDEALTWRLIAGTCLIVSGVWGVARKR